MDTSKGTTIKFDMNEDNKIRQQARKEYEIAKNFKLLNLPVYKFYSASDISARKQFNLAQKTDLSIIEIKLTNDFDKNFDLVNQVKDYISTQNNIELKDDKEFTYIGSDKVHRFLVFCK